MLTISAPEIRMDWSRGIDDWQVVTGRWSVESDAGQAVLMQRGREHPFHVIVAPGAPVADVDASVRFKPIGGQEDASGGIVFRFDRGRYYVIRANALEDNFRLYQYDGSRRRIASAHVSAPALGAWHTIRVVAVGDRIQGYLDGQLLIDHHDARLPAGQIGLWTKADSVTAFADFIVRGATTR